VVYEDFAYRIDRRKSELRGFFDDNGFWWTLRISCLSENYPDDDEERLPPPCAPSLDLTFPRGIGPAKWQGFEYVGYSFQFDDRITFPILPGIPSGAYIGWHHSCPRHEISFAFRHGNMLQLRWKPLAKEDEYDSGTIFYVDASVPFTGLTYFGGDGEVDLHKLKQSIGERFVLSEFRKARIQKPYVRFELKPQVGEDDEE